MQSPVHSSPASPPIAATPAAHHPWSFHSLNVYLTASRRTLRPGSEAPQKRNVVREDDFGCVFCGMKPGPHRVTAEGHSHSLTAAISRVGQPGQAAVHDNADRANGLGLRLRRPRVDVRDEVLLVPWPARNCSRRCKQNRAIEHRQRSRQCLDLRLAERAATQGPTGQPGHQHRGFRCLKVCFTGRGGQPRRVPRCLHTFADSQAGNAACAGRSPQERAGSKKEVPSRPSPSCGLSRARISFHLDGATSGPPIHTPGSRLPNRRCSGRPRSGPP